MLASSPMQGASAYLTDVPYLRHFCKELAPPLLRAAVALNGFRPPPDDAFDYCELGCGTGDTLATLAAATLGRASSGSTSTRSTSRSHARSRLPAASATSGSWRWTSRTLAHEPLPDFDYIARQRSPELDRSRDTTGGPRLRRGAAQAGGRPRRQLQRPPGMGGDRAASPADAARPPPRSRGPASIAPATGWPMARLFRDAGAEYFTQPPLGAGDAGRGAPPGAPVRGPRVPRGRVAPDVLRRRLRRGRRARSALRRTAAALSQLPRSGHPGADAGSVPADDRSRRVREPQGLRDQRVLPPRPVRPRHGAGRGGGARVPGHHALRDDRSPPAGSGARSACATTRCAMASRSSTR